MVLNIESAGHTLQNQFISHHTLTAIVREFRYIIRDIEIEISTDRHTNCVDE